MWAQEWVGTQFEPRDSISLCLTLNLDHSSMVEPWLVSLLVSSRCTSPCTTAAWWSRLERMKLLERIILSCITPIVDPFIPSEQAGFRKHRNTTEQVLVLTTCIESELFLLTSQQLMTLSVCLMLKLARIIPCKKML